MRCQPRLGSTQAWAKLLCLLTVNSLSYFVKIKYKLLSLTLQRLKNFSTVTSLTQNSVKKKVTVTSLPLITVSKNLSSLSYFNDHKIRSIITTANPKKIFGVRRRRRRRRRRPSPPPSPPSTVAAAVGESPTPRIGESGSRLFEQILGPLKQRHHQRQKFFFQCIVLDYMHVFARYSLKWTFRKY